MYCLFSVNDFSAGQTGVNWAEAVPNWEPEEAHSFDRDLDDVCELQSRPQEEGDYHGSTPLLLWTPAEEKHQRQGEDKDGQG